MRPRILVVAYACEPGAGSESGAGCLTRMLARFADVWVATRENNQAGIEASLREVPERDHLRLIEKAFWRLKEFVADRVIDGMSNERDGLASG